MTDLTHDVSEASELIAFGLRPRLLPARDLNYADRVRRYTDDDDFADLVRAVAEGLSLRVLAVSQPTGIVLAPREESVFATKYDDYARRAALAGRSVDRVIHGIAHIAIAALAFPREDDLANNTYVGSVNVEEVDAVVREACRLLEQKAKEAEENHDPLDTAPDLERAWRAYARRPAATATKDNRLAPDSTRGMITKAVRFLVDQGFLNQRARDTTGVYFTTPKYQVQVRELAAQAAFRELLALGIVAVGDARGTLRVVPDASAPDADNIEPADGDGSGPISLVSLDDLATPDGTGGDAGQD